MKKLRIASILSIPALSLIIFLFSILLFIVALKPEVVNRVKLLLDSQYKYAENIVSICQNNLNWRYCYGKQIAQINYRLSFPDTLQVLEQVKKLDNKTRDCHLISHYIAASEVEKSPGDWINIFDYVDQTTCINGFIHGVLEGRKRFDSDLVLDETTIPQICDQIEQKTSVRVSKVREEADKACVHIIGHILLVQEYGRIDDAISICSKIPQAIKRYCLNGLFMENITRDNLEEHGIAKKFAMTKDASLKLEELCRQYDKDVGWNCWRNLAFIYTHLANNDPDQVFQLCYRTSNESYAQACFINAVNLMVLSKNYSDQNLADTCRNYWKSAEITQDCIVTALSPLLGSSVDFIDRAIIFCNAQPPQYQAFCYDTVGQEIVPRTSPEKRNSLCKNVPKQYFANCMSSK